MRKLLAAVAAAALMGGALGGCAGTRDTNQDVMVGARVEMKSLQQPMTEALGALDELGARLGEGKTAEGRQAYQVFAAAFGKVLGPVSFNDVAAAQTMANANSTLHELLAQKQPDRAAVARASETIRQAIQQIASRNGLSLVASASAAVGPDLAARTRIIDVRAREYRFEPARIEVKKGERVTVRLHNVGTEQHEWELDAFHVEIPRTRPGGTNQVTFTADKAGTFEYVCRVDNHDKKGMRGFFIVK